MLQIYRILTVILFPFFIIIGILRILVHKESIQSFVEKIFCVTNKNYNKNLNLIWFHGSSIGEITSVTPIVNYLLKKKQKILITSNSLTSAYLIKKKFSNKVFYQHLPLDLVHLNKKFLDYWSPKSAIFIDSEIWPNFIHEIKKREIRLVLINARITDRSFKKWKIFFSFAKKIFSNFDLCISSSKDTSKKLKELEVKNLKYFGNLKYISELNKRNKNNKKNKTLSNRKVWCAASTHSGEENFCLNIHKTLRKKEKKLLTIIAPRHIDRSQEIIDLCKKNNFFFQIINTVNEKIKKNTEILIINSFGILDYYYKFSTSVFMGKSLLKRLKEDGGQNPIEAVRNGCWIYSGPYTYNFDEVYNFLNIKNIAKKISHPEQLAEEINKDFKRSKISKKRIAQIDSFGHKIFKKTLFQINKINSI